MAEDGNSAITVYTDKTICDLLTTFAESTYYVDKENKPNPHIESVIMLMEKDYKVARISNDLGHKCFQYPSTIPIMESRRHVTTIYENEENQTRSVNVKELDELFEKAKIARCRQRFPVPVILFRGQYICRSSTLASVPEICYRGKFPLSGIEYLKAVKEFLWPSEESSPETASDGAWILENKLPEYCENLRNNDIELLRCLNVKNIVDIMVEKRKVKHGLYVSSSEKVDQDRYSTFRLLCLPYPGCEFFTQFHQKMHQSEGLKYDWSRPSNDAELSVPNDNLAKTLGIGWDQYKEWDLIVMTQNYMKYIIKRLQEDNGGLVLHCISGWDRTPLFMSLIRLSLWADGLVHESLNEHEITYLTVAYDWYLFGHHLSDRLAKNEEIMAFCFDFLKHMSSEQFSARSVKKKHSEEKIGDDSRSPSRGSNASSVNTMEENSDVIDRKFQAANISEMGINENSNESTPLMEMELDESQYEDAHSSHSNGGEFAETHGSPEKLNFLDVYEVLPSEDALMDALNEAICRNKVLNPTTLMTRKSSPITIGSPTKRQRSTSTGSSASNISGTWQIINDCGSVEQENTHLKPMRVQKLEKVRVLFKSCYQKTVKKESYGPPKSVVEDIVVYISNILERKTKAAENPNHTDDDIFIVISEDDPLFKVGGEISNQE